MSDGGIDAVYARDPKLKVGIVYVDRDGLSDAGPRALTAEPLQRGLYYPEENRDYVSGRASAVTRFMNGLRNSIDGSSCQDAVPNS